MGSHDLLVLVRKGSSGQPYPDVRIDLAGTEIRQGVTDPAGQASFSFLPAGDYLLIATPVHRSNIAAQKRFSLPGGSFPETLEIPLSVGSRIHVVVRDGANYPLADATVSVSMFLLPSALESSWTQRGPRDAPMWVETTGLDGRAMIGPLSVDGALPTRTLGVQISKGGYFRTLKSIRVAEGEDTSLDVTLRDVGEPVFVSGVVVGANGLPVDLAEVLAVASYVEEGAPTRSTLSRTTTSSDGSFQFSLFSSSLQDAQLSLMVNAHGYSPYEEAVQMDEPAGGRALRIVLASAAILTVLVRDEQSIALEGVEVWLFPVEGGADLGMVETDSEGMAVFDAVASGLYSVRLANLPADLLGGESRRVGAPGEYVFVPLRRR